MSDTCRIDSSGSGHFYTLENVQIDWVGEEELGAIFYHPEGETPSEQTGRVNFLNGNEKPLRFATHYRGVPNDTVSPLAT